MERVCKTCKKDAGNRKCSGCSRAWYCSPQCQKDDWFFHKVNCTTKKGPTTADYLMISCVQNLIPSHEQTLIDYGFNRAFSGENESKLLGLYVGLWNLGVTAKTLHRWRKDGILISEIKRKFDSLPLGDQDIYYSWFLQNEWVLDGKTPEEWGHQDAVENFVAGLVNVGWAFSGGSPTISTPEITKILRKWPSSRRDCLEFCGLLLSDHHPCSAEGIWITFGFCTCKDLQAAIDLSVLYQVLLRSCNFEGLVTAYEKSCLFDLLLKKCHMSEPMIRALNPHLKEVLALSPAENRSVWYLKQFIIYTQEPVVHESDTYLRPCESVMVDYGFINCKSDDEFKGLKAIYKTLLEKTDAELPDLHQACFEGNLYEFVSKWVKITEKKKYKSLMMNPYPSA
ncbi:hypothetical protein BDN70DRAFT_860497 [Pholiota conissans]|uniref:MYND-type domain-containing protein n=1 Tax=Pholiota conissans TaxID=109636 RepID=A0A9P5YYP7_9AGAR|nr:hypothetical protein BDN70DRAFT_860497 [Pholiota conissans]